MGGLILFLLLVDGILLWNLFRQRRSLRNLTAQAERFLDGQEHYLPVSLKEGDTAALQNALSRLENQLLLSREQTRREAKRSTDLLTDISHQLKTPLASLQLFLELDNGAHLPQETQLLERMQTLISSLLRLERLCNDGYPFRFCPQNLEELILSCWQNLQPLYPEKQFTLEGSGKLHCDEIWLGEAILNLLKNACEHTPPDGQILVLLEQYPQELHITIRDNGGGVDSQELPRLFERFYQAKGQKGNGVGIGLSIVKEIVHRHHGNISAANIPGGLEMKLYFPKLDEILSKS